MKFIFKIISIIAFIVILDCLNHITIAQVVKSNSPESQVFYHIFLRSFYDSNGDGHGDLKGLEEKLDYLQELGITSVLITPLYHSDFYHNYFPIDFEEIDPEFGTKEDYFGLVKEMHRRGMKLIMDMEIHYVTEDHLWYKDSYQNPASPYSNHILYNDANNTDPESIIYNLTELKSYDGKIIKVATTNLYHDSVRNYHYQLFKYWVDPNRDGNFEDGIDGFRIDHIMDDLDWKGKLTGLLSNFWKPLFAELRAINPDIIIIGEQAEWGYGGEYFAKADLDAVFAFPLSQAIRKFNSKKVQQQWLKTFQITPMGKHQFIFIENHDMPRIASVLDRNLSKLKVCAALNLLLKGVPIIYYGQEIGMTGANSLGQFGSTDGNDIPVREAFEWYRTVDGPGMALWYKSTGPWWDQSELKDNDGISLEEQQSDPTSLWSCYRQLIRLRRGNSALQTGSLEFLEDQNDDVLSFLRWDEAQAILVLMNLSDKSDSVSLDLSQFPMKIDLAEATELLQASPQKTLQIDPQKIRVSLDKFEIQVWQIK
ncbi:MAG: alpha-amylase family glycosyl hydrolase [candidate division KSB1 bacterium]|nr:alpha-amylase family glycosyl hydrolase [candidate division KSB1 bacterium]MDZ7336575.1 alpha-amylase family glycosyl hydrolase [candidate division KSB1 bacterium]MDZ7358886.1 alpha-amylase family glycosyl hydrolase [candidate division KSB1 bacterium]